MINRPDGGFWGSLRRSAMICGKVIPLNLIPPAVSAIGWSAPNAAIKSFLAFTIISGLIGLWTITRGVGILSGVVFIATYACISAVAFIVVRTSINYLLYI